MGKRAAGLVVGVLALVLVGCNSGGSSSSTVAGVGLDMPTEISAVPASGGGSSKLAVALMALGAAADPGTDYSNAQTVRFVNEPTLEQFEIIETILDAMAQTHYADSDNINAGPYKAMVAFEDEQNGVETKMLEPWVVQSDLISEGGQTVNRVRVWIEENMDGMVRTIKAEVKIYEAASKNADGSYADYGVWTINAKFDDMGTNFFAAEASRGSNGETILALHERMQEGPTFTHQVKAYLNKSDTSGYGRVDYPDWNSCTNWPCDPGMTSAAYAYNATNLGVQKQGEAVPTFKNRTTITELTHRYGMFDSETGENVLKTKSFGFPVRFTDSTGTHFAYYGSWQGRHQLWSDIGLVPDDTTVTREDHGANQTAETYTTVSFVGTLTKRTMVDADIADIQDLPFETWINSGGELIYSAGSTSWYENVCQPPPGTCTPSSTAFDLNKLIVDPNNNRKFVDVNGFNLTGFPPNTSVRLMYDPDGTISPHTQGAGFYEVQGAPPTVTHMNNKYTPADNDRIWVNVGGSIYIEYKGATIGWVEKELVNFDTRTWTPEFGTNDRPYELEQNREHYINNQGANYVVKRTGTGVTAADHEVMIELQTAANPVNYATVLSGVDHFRAQWGSNTYRFETAPGLNFLKLVAESATDSQGNPLTQGDVITEGQWGLVAVDAADSDIVDGQGRLVQFNWEYPRPGENWGTLTYLVDANSAYKLLDDPIALAPVTLANGAGVQKTLSLRYDGWMHGLPDLFEELRKSDFVVTPAIADKIINIPAGTQGTDASDSSKTYLIKPMEVSEFLAVVPDPGNLDLTTANAVNLDALAPNFVEHGMGAMPNVTTVKYSEGNLVE